MFLDTNGGGGFFLGGGGGGSVRNYSTSTLKKEITI